ncbi:MAG: electron transfer flavoprotein subunit alpha/FixB family protein [Syntrophomonadaceae bacterium]|jgi:electron transfer flavoprotein alpha subunit
MAGIFVMADNRELTLEMMNAGLMLAAKLQTGLIVLTQGETADAQELIKHGADEVILIPALGEGQLLGDYVASIAAEIEAADADVFLLSATFQGRELAARLAARLQTGLCTECIGFEVDSVSGRLLMERLMFGGAALQQVECAARPQMATIPPRAFEPAPVMEGKQGRIKALEAIPPSSIKVLERKASQREAGDITQARVIVCAGRGVERQEDMAMVKELADLLGAEIACTRPLAEEMHWLPESCCIGLSGKQVKPDLYIGIGVSGQVQHVCGLRDARVICSINKDENALIFQSSDYGIEGDLYQVLPLLIQEIKQILG